MERDLKILLWIFVVSFLVFIIYSIVDYTFSALDNPRTWTYYASTKPTYSRAPDAADPDIINQPKVWGKPREPLPFLGYVHLSIVFLITGIFVIALMGFIITYYMTKRE